MKERNAIEEIHVMVGQAGYTYSVEVVRYTDAGDGTERKRSLGLFTHKFGSEGSGDDGDGWQREVVRELREEIAQAVKMVTLRRMGRAVKNKPMRFRDPQPSRDNTQATLGERLEGQE